MGVVLEEAVLASLVVRVLVGLEGVGASLVVFERVAMEEGVVASEKVRVGVTLEVPVAPSLHVRVGVTLALPVALSVQVRVAVERRLEGELVAEEDRVEVAEYVPWQG